MLVEYFLLLNSFFFFFLFDFFIFFFYIFIFIYFFFCLLLASALFLVSFILIYQNPNAEKISVYECGFSSFGDSRSRFEIRFYIVAILFMIFDLEIVFLFP